MKNKVVWKIEVRKKKKSMCFRVKRKKHKKNIRLASEILTFRLGFGIDGMADLGQANWPLWGSSWLMCMRRGWTERSLGPLQPWHVWIQRSLYFFFPLGQTAPRSESLWVMSGALRIRSSSVQSLAWPELHSPTALLAELSAPATPYIIIRFPSSC